MGLKIFVFIKVSQTLKDKNCMFSMTWNLDVENASKKYGGDSGKREYETKRKN